MHRIQTEANKYAKKVEYKGKVKKEINETSSRVEMSKGKRNKRRTAVINHWTKSYQAVQKRSFHRSRSGS